MTRRFSPIIAVVAALLLLCAQQGAFAHLIGHLGAAPQVSAQQEEPGHNAALALADVCTTCIALSVLGGPPSAAFQAAQAFMGGEDVPHFNPAHLPIPHRPLPRARAPPAASAS